MACPLPDSILSQAQTLCETLLRASFSVLLNLNLSQLVSTSVLSQTVDHHMKTVQVRVNHDCKILQISVSVTLVSASLPVPHGSVFLQRPQQSPHSPGHPAPPPRRPRPRRHDATHAVAQLRELLLILRASTDFAAVFGSVWLLGCVTNHTSIVELLDRCP